MSLAGLDQYRGHARELLIGPEGGLDDAELERARQRGDSRPCGLDHVYCARETAGIVALTVLQALWGDLQ